MSVFPEYPGEERPRIELIPMIDVMFFLLVVFIFLSISLMRVDAVSVSLPDAASHPLTGKSRILNITIRKDGSLFLGKIRMNKAGIQRALSMELKRSPSPEPVVVSADRGANVQRLVDILDLCRSVGVSDLLIRTESR